MGDAAATEIERVTAPVDADGAMTAPPGRAHAAPAGFFGRQAEAAEAGS